MLNTEVRIEAQDLNQQGATLLKVGKYEAAESKFKQAIELEPMLMDSYKNYGDLQMAIQNYPEAKKYYKKAILIEKNGGLYFAYGNACFMNDEFHEGLENYNLAISNGFDSDEMMFFMGMAYEHMNDDHMALRYFQKACIKNPSRPDYIVKKISVFVRLDMLESAEQATEELLHIAPELYDGYHIKTQLLIEMGELEQAEAFSKMATEKFPEDVDLMLDHIRCIALKNEIEKALHLVTQAKQMKYFDNAKQRILLLEAELAAENIQYDYAAKCCEECISLEESIYADEARFVLLNLRIVKSEFEAAYEIACEIINSEKENLYYYAALYYRPHALRQIGKEEDAQKFFREANSIYRLKTLKNPEAIDIYLYRALCLKDLEQYDKALELLDFITEISNGITEVHTIRAEIYRLLGQNAKSDEEMEKAYSLKPELRP